MHFLTKWFTKNPVAANLITIVLLIAGFFTIKNMRIEGFPAIPPRTINIETIHIGANVEQVDRGVTKRIEQALESLPGLDKIYSVSLENLSNVTIMKKSGFNIDRFQNEIKTRIDAIENFPQKAQTPIISREEHTIEALIVQLYGNQDRLTLQKTARIVKKELLSHPKITKIKEFGLINYEIGILLNQDKLRKFDLSFDDIIAVINQNSVDYNTGSLKSETGKIIIRTDKKAFEYEDFSSMPVKTLKNGSRILLKDIATIRDDLEDVDYFARYQGQSSVGFQVYTSKKDSLLEVSKAAQDVVNKIQTQIPHGLKLDIWGKSSDYMTQRLKLLKNNAWQGLLIVFILLSIFLNFKLAFWVAMGIPISFAGAFIFMNSKFLDYTLNDITTFGLIIVLGILVDDAIVVGESIFEERKKNKNAINGTIKGVHKVAAATVFGCFTTVAAFYPLLLIDNEIGKIFGIFATVVIIALLFSLLESKLILPAHLAGIEIKEDKKATNIISVFYKFIQHVASSILFFLNQKIYKPLLSFCLKNRYSTIIILLTIATIGIGVIYKGFVKVAFFPEIPGQIIMVSMDMKKGSPLNITTKNMITIEDKAKEINEEFLNNNINSLPPIRSILTAIMDSESVLIYAELQPEKKRTIKTMKIIKKWRDKVGALENIENINFSGSFETGGGFSLEIISSNESNLNQSLNFIIKELGSINGVSDVRDDHSKGAPQIRLKLKKEAEHLGITNYDLARQIGDAYGGFEVQRFQRGSDEVKVNLSFDKNEKKYTHDLMKMRIKTNEGSWIPLLSVAELKKINAMVAITRRNGKRAVELKAAIDRSKTSSSEVFKIVKTKILPKIKVLYPDVEINGIGELEEMEVTQKGLKRALIVILILIYTLLAIPLKSYWQPIVIMSVIPFGFVGSIIGHAVMKQPLSILSFFGMLAASGVVVNDSLVMMTRFNDLKIEGATLRRSLIQAGSSRFRPIFLTTATTVCGLMPLLLETSEQAQYLIPAAISLAWGELFATPITLIIIPVIIRVKYDSIFVIKQIFSKSDKKNDWMVTNIT